MKLFGWHTKRNKLDCVPDAKPWAEFRHGNKRRWIALMKVKLRKQKRAVEKQEFQRESDEK